MNAELDAHDRPDPADLRRPARRDHVRVRGRRAGRADEPVPLGRGSRPHAPRDGQRQGPPGSVPQPDHAAGLRRDSGARTRRWSPASPTGRRSASSRRSSPTPPGFVVRCARDVARARVPRRRDGASARSTTSTSSARSEASSTTSSARRSRRSTASPSIPIPSSSTTSTSTRWATVRSTRSSSRTTSCTSRCPTRSPAWCCSATTSPSRSAARSSRSARWRSGTLKAGEVLDDYGMYMTYGEAVNADEMSSEPLPAGGARRGLPPPARRPEGRRAHATTTSSSRPAAWPIGSAPSSTASSVARRGWRICSRFRPKNPFQNGARSPGSLQTVASF